MYVYVYKIYMCVCVYTVSGWDTPVVITGLLSFTLRMNRKNIEGNLKLKKGVYVW